MYRGLYRSLKSSLAYPRFRLAGLGLIVLALVASACAAPAQPAPAAPAQEQPTAEAAPQTVPNQGATSTPGAGGTAMVMLARNDKMGQILTDDKGMTLYLYTKDSPNTSVCYDNCATAWPPLLTSGMPAGGDGTDASLLGTATRKDGSTQVTYNGWPLYHYFKDQKAGDVTGEDVGGVWYVVSAKGDKIEPEDVAQAEETPGTETPAAQPSASVQPTTAPNATGTGQASGQAMVKLAQNDTLGQYLADEKGMTLYLYTKDSPNTSVCYDKCATAWPPLLTSGAPMGADGVDASLLGTTTRTDGSMQVTYNSWPLYYWFKDQKPGDTAGQLVGGVWFVVSPQGEKITTPTNPTPEPTAAASGQAAGQTAGQTAQVDLMNIAYSPKTLTVAAGTKVVWTNRDNVAHTVTADDGSFDSGNMDPGATFEFTFSKAGTFAYYCMYHGGKGGVGMAGQVIVK